MDNNSNPDLKPQTEQPPSWAQDMEVSGPLAGPFFVVLEGMPGTGKSTLAPRVADYLTARTARHTVVLSDPDGNRHSSPFWTMLEKHRTGAAQLDPHELALCYLCNRVQLSQIVQEHLDKGHNVVMDRWFLSTLVFQDRAFPTRGKLDLFLWASESLGVLNPHLTIILVGITHEEFKFRIQNRADRAVDHINSLDWQRWSMIYDNAALLCDSEENPVESVWALNTPDVVESSVVSALENRLFAPKEVEVA